MPVLFLTKAGMCCKSIGHKNHDKNKCRRDGARREQKGDGCRDGGILRTRELNNLPVPEKIVTSI